MNGKIHYFDWAIFNSYFDITRGYLVAFQRSPAGPQISTDLHRAQHLRTRWAVPRWWTWRRSWRRRVLGWGFSGGILGKTMGKPWENHGKILKMTLNMMKIWGKTWENNAKPHQVWWWINVNHPFSGHGEKEQQQIFRWTRVVLRVYVGGRKLTNLSSSYGVPQENEGAGPP